MKKCQNIHGLRHMCKNQFRMFRGAIRSADFFRDSFRNFRVLENVAQR